LPAPLRGGLGSFPASACEIFDGDKVALRQIFHPSRKLGVKRWTVKALDREKWASIIREAKAKLRRP